MFAAWKYVEMSDTSGNPVWTVRGPTDGCLVIAILIYSDEFIVRPGTVRQ